MKKYIIYLCILINLMTLPAWAKETIHEAKDTKTIFTYIQDDLYKVYTTTDKLTEIRLQPGETPLYMGGGDSSAWNCEVIDTTNDDGSTQSSIFLKSVIDYKFVSNVVISTDRRSYRIMLCAIPAGKYNAIVSWTYPADETAAQKQIMNEIEEELSLIPSDWSLLNKNYSIEAKKSYPWCPVLVFDDGTKTYIQLAEKAESYSLPAVFEKKNKELHIVNYRFKSGYFIIDQLCEEIYLIDGNDEIRIVKTSDPKKFNHHSCGRELF